MRHADENPFHQFILPTVVRKSEQPVNGHQTDAGDDLSPGSPMEARRWDVVKGARFAHGPIIPPAGPPQPHALRRDTAYRSRAHLTGAIAPGVVEVVDHTDPT